MQHFLVCRPVDKVSKGTGMGEAWEVDPEVQQVAMAVGMGHVDGRQVWGKNNLLDGRNCWVLV